MCQNASQTSYRPSPDQRLTSGRQRRCPGLLHDGSRLLERDLHARRHVDHEHADGSDADDGHRRCRHARRHHCPQQLFGWVALDSRTKALRDRNSKMPKFEENIFEGVINLAKTLGKFLREYFSWMDYSPNLRSHHWLGWSRSPLKRL